MQVLGQQAQEPASANPALGSEQQRLRDEVNQWMGTPHRMGGTSRKGIDCSAFVQRIYKDAYQQHIPRSSTLQIKAGVPINKKHLRLVDLVSFKIPLKGPHVGIYVGGKEFAHASTSKGVMISSLEEDYWRACYWAARRYSIATD